MCQFPQTAAFWVCAGPHLRCCVSHQVVINAKAYRFQWFMSLAVECHDTWENGLGPISCVFLTAYSNGDCRVLTGRWQRMPQRGPPQRKEPKMAVALLLLTFLTFAVIDWLLSRN